MFSNRDFVWAREIIQKSLTLDSGNIVNFIQTFGSLVSISYNLVLVFWFLNKILELLIFYWENSDFLATNFSIQKSLFKNIFGC